MMSWSRNPKATNRKISKEGTAQELVIGSQKQVSSTSPEGVNPKVPNKLLFTAAAQNEIRKKQASLEDKDILGEPNNYCSSNPKCFLPSNC